MRGAVEVSDNLHSVFGLGGTIQPAVVQSLCHAVALQHVEQLTRLNANSIFRKG